MTNFLKATALSLALVGSTAFATAAQAQTLIVDVEQIYRDSTAAKSGNQQLEAKYGARIRAAQTNLDTAVKGWNDQVTAAKAVAKPNTPLPPATEKALTDARQRLQEAQAQAEELQREVQQLGQYVQLQILDKLLPIAEQIRKDRKANTVVARGSILAFDAAYDITPSAMQQLNAALTTVSITPPQQQQQPAGTTPPAQPTTKQPASR
ncbi:OmpH family outer membrane protein [Sphingomonas sp.]|uniref:OmpH family outer membrane protein n=1 Tax=Sphingomonas sp. TaxID=28214 RepID=UPI001DA9B498|nr:OmpH family outer membrane protein [Sphingomonas sp.]MBX9796984.1 OmpH family outer membrane protein [Sphingomonas sp.]